MKKRRLQTLDRFIEQIPGDDATGVENIKPLADLLEAEIITSGKNTILKIIDDHELFPYSSLKDISEHQSPDIYRRWHFNTGDSDDNIDPSRFLFFDTETTGLSGGAGMVIFLCGFGFFYKNRFRVVQYFLPDYPDEPFFLEMARRHLTPDTVLVTYNGKAFDWPFLAQRFTINRLDIPEIADHIDVLHSARTLFRNLGDDCTLITLEKEVLSFDRGEDIPGYLIPSKYFDYLFDRQPGMIPEIIRHNRLDVISLALITRFVPEFISRPETINRPELLEGVISHYFKNRRHQSLINYLRLTGPGYLEETSSVAHLKYSLVLKKCGYLEEASRLWREAAEKRDQAGLLGHLLELAKYQEHREKDFSAALETVDLILQLDLTSTQHKDAEKRRLRLERKLSQI